ncbi:uroporphyrinogen-III synthase [Marinifilum caeruleilacunae]|uniref:Uroporphyrinogen-III synthase n=1 Tax=Marinifilum caeruleilacunae TaxID=2499076 RepID=A0ABX1WQN1_9BACT|nr:uroporphyrinogen-III synthase [Marinifilum caeruleilacunae]NOU58391.1 uroporphyrinogen-III synthase [Marinifilum caeruleilacunae]
MNSGKLQKILFTRQLSDKHYDFGKKLGLSIEDYPFIEIEIKHLHDEEIRAIEQDRNASWIFTSKNAVQSLVDSLANLSDFTDRKCFAVGEKTAETLRNYNFEVIVPDSHNALSLVDRLANESANTSYFYFSGNMRRKTISNFFLENDIHYREVECYKTNLIQPDLDHLDFDAVCFCSPSAVLSFFSKYQLKEEIPCIAIGNTTAVKLLDYSENVAMSEKTNIYSMLEICNEYLNI